MNSTLRNKAIFVLAILLVLIFSKYFYMASIGSYFTFYLIHHFGIPVAQAQLHLFAFLVASAAGGFLGGPLGDRIGRKPILFLACSGRWCSTRCSLSCFRCS